MYAATAVLLGLASLFLPSCKRDGPSAASVAAPEARPATGIVGHWHRRTDDGRHERLVLHADGRFGYLHATEEAPIGRVMGRWQRVGGGVRFAVDLTEPEGATIGLATRWQRADAAGDRLDATAGTHVMRWERRELKAHDGLWVVAARGEETLLRGTLSNTGPNGTSLDVLAVAYHAGSHPYVSLRTEAGDEVELYEAPSTDRLTLTVPPALLRRWGVEAPDDSVKYGSYVPLADLQLTAKPADGLRNLPLRALTIKNLPVAKMSGPGSSRGDRPEDALVHLALTLTETKTAGLDPRAPVMVGEVRRRKARAAKAPAPDKAAP